MHKVRSKSGISVRMITKVAIIVLSIKDTDCTLQFMTGKAIIYQLDFVYDISKKF